MARYNKQDAFHRRAKQENFAARSVYKLEELDQRFQLLSRGDRVIDLGCSPGSWLQYIGAVVGPTGLVLGYDLVLPSVSPGPQVLAHALDVHTLTPELILEHAKLQPGARFDALLSDMAPKTTGVRDVDQSRSIGLVEKALELADALLKFNGVFAAKLFQGRGFDPLLADLRRRFGDVKVLRPKATREGSREAFIVARGRRPSPQGGPASSGSEPPT